MGVGHTLKRRDQGVLVVAVEPSRSPMISKGQTEPHGIPGIGADFVPPLLDRSIIDEVIPVSDEDAPEMSLRVAREEGLMMGISSGATVVAAIQVSGRLGPDNVVVTILADTGERYLSFPT